MKRIAINLSEPFEDVLAAVQSLASGGPGAGDDELKQALRGLYEAANGRQVETPIGWIAIAPPVAAFLKLKSFYVETQIDLLVEAAARIIRGPHYFDGTSKPAVAARRRRSNSCNQGAKIATVSAPSLSLSRTRLHNCDIAIDVGNSMIRVAQGRGPVRERCSVGSRYKPLVGGVIANPDATVELLHPLLRQTCPRRGYSRLRLLGCVPTDATPDEKAALINCSTRAGASAVFICQEPFAAAIGAGIDLSGDDAKVIIDLGDGVTDCAVIKGARIIKSMAMRTGCADFRGSIRAHILKHHCVTVGEPEAQRVLLAVGVGESGARKVTVTGRRDGSACRIAISAVELQAAFAPEFRRIQGLVEALLRDLPAELFVHVIEHGIFLTGGGALLKGMQQELAQTARVDVHVVPDPLRAVVHGARVMLPAVSALHLWQDQ